MIRTVPVPNGDNLPFSAVATFGQLVFISGQVGVDRATGHVADGFEAQCVQTMKNVSEALALGGSSLANVVKVTVFFTPGTDVAVFNRVYAEFFGEHKPARSVVTVASLAPGRLVEVECIGVTG